MGTGCIYKIGHNPNTQTEGINLEKTNVIKLNLRKKQIFQTQFSEASFMELTTPRSGTHIKWRRGDLIGEGAYAKVYQCLNIITGELLALKTFYISENPRKIEREFQQMRKEIRVLKTLNHENVVHYYQADLSEDLKSVDILLEYVPGGSLKSILIKYKSLEISVIKNYSRQLLRGLNYLHDNKIIHRDLKPANVLISPTGMLKLTDFGSSKQFDDLESNLSKSLKGSPYWMAPEVVRMEGHSFSADIWSFGCILIEMVSGKPPWSNYSNDSKAVMELISKEGLLPDIPSTEPLLQEIITHCVNRNPNERPSPPELLESEFFKN
ncbi:hypothetical protein SteCoe_5689 [Stentor coeruleus]|uniref:Protein kinase domain-containing protein n=1 Tax=Stentor coeruleus TaxID=5963 RepID=A0A1R2CRM4_9CILI|nr:hypothetical protein SteCoe_5689 [Stentor coeruleus]